MLSKLLIYFFIYKIYYNWLTNLKISYFFKKCTPSFYGTNVSCYVKFKLLY